MGGSINFLYWTELACNVKLSRKFELEVASNIANNKFRAWVRRHDTLFSQELTVRSAM